MGRRGLCMQEPCSEQVSTALPSAQVWQQLTSLLLYDRISSHLALLGHQLLLPAQVPMLHSQL